MSILTRTAILIYPYRLADKMSLGDIFLPWTNLFSGAGHVGQRLFPGAPQAENFCVSSRLYRLQDPRSL